MMKRYVRRIAVCLGLTVALLAGAYIPATALDIGQTVDSTVDKVGGYLDDSAVTAAVKARFLAQKGLDSLDLRVETTKGVVTVRGQVQRQEQADLAIRVVRETDGVRGVVNKISVMP